MRKPTNPIKLLMYECEKFVARWRFALNIHTRDAERTGEVGDGTFKRVTASSAHGRALPSQQTLKRKGISFVFSRFRHKPSTCSHVTMSIHLAPTHPTVPTVAPSGLPIPPPTPPPALPTIEIVPSACGFSRDLWRRNERRAGHVVRVIPRANFGVGGSGRGGRGCS